MFSLDGLVALVTGAGSPAGIGFAAARLLGHSGATVALAATTERVRARAAELDALEITTSAHLADLTDRAAARALVYDVLTRHGRIDILINNAGMAQVGSPEVLGTFLEQTDDDWDRAIARNLTTAVTVTREVLPGMLRHRFGRIIMVSSVTGPVVANPGSAGYAAAKAGMVGLTRALALETAPHGVTVNAVGPGWIATASATDAELNAGTHTPLGRPGTPDEVAAVIGFLAAREASYLTGQLLVVDGGNSIQEYKGPPEEWY